MKAIVYTSNTGNSEYYSQLLAQQIGLPAYSLTQAKKILSSDTEIIYFGWVMAGTIKGYASANKKFNILAVCAVGMCQSGSQIEILRKKNNISDKVALFSLQGNLDIKKLHGFYRLMMNIMVKVVVKELKDKKDCTLEEKDMLEMMLNKKEIMKTENLKPVIDWFNNML